MLALLWRGVAFFTPGGWIVSVAVTAFKAVGTFLMWLMADIADAFKEPWRFVVRTVCLVIVLLLGVYLGMDYMRDQRDVWRDAHAKIMDDSRKADAANKQLLSTALKAKADAEAQLLVRKVKALPVGPAPAPKRVQPKRAAAGAGKAN